MKKKKYLIIPVFFIVFVAIFLIFIVNRPHASFSEKWNAISHDFEDINNYAITKFSDDMSYIQLSDLADSNDEKYIIDKLNNDWYLVFQHHI